MKKTSVVLVFDIGTQSTRALLVSSEGKYWQKPRRAIIRLMFQENPDGQNRILIFITRICAVFPDSFGRAFRIFLLRSGQ